MTPHFFEIYCLEKGDPLTWKYYWKRNPFYSIILDFFQLSMNLSLSFSLFTIREVQDNDHDWLYFFLIWWPELCRTPGSPFWRTLPNLRAMRKKQETDSRNLRKVARNVFLCFQLFFSHCDLIALNIIYRITCVQGSGHGHWKAPI